MTSKPWTFWIDTGGTFTDCIAHSPEGEIKKLKVLSSAALRGRIIEKTGSGRYRISHNWPVKADIFSGYNFRLTGNYSLTALITETKLEDGIIVLNRDLEGEILANHEFEILSGEEAPLLCARLATCTMLQDAIPPMEMRLGSTKGTNALLERKGCKTALVVTKGFADVIEIGTQQRPDIFALNVRKVKPLYAEVFEVDERMDSEGHCVRPISKQSIDYLCNALLNSNIEAVAVALINSYRNDSHEKQLESAIKKSGITQVSLSATMAREIRILPRAHTSIINAYLSPVIRNYLNDILTKVPSGALKIMTSAGGLVDARQFEPKDSLLSGPAGGVVGAVHIARAMGRGRILAFDMGGTSTDVSRYDGNYDYCFEMEIDGVPVFSPSMAIETVAAGGGSVCSYDGYKLIVGPESAGAFPGPACYGVGGPLAITDVNLLLGRVDPENFGIPLNKDAATRALNQLGSRMTREANDDAMLNGFLKIANEKMAEAIRKISLSKGYDPSGYTLLAFGGAGGQHACAVADLLGIREIIVPFDAGLLSAFGMGVAEIERFASRQLLVDLNHCLPELDALFIDLSDEARYKLRKEGVADASMYIRRQVAHVRFKGQESTLEVPYTGPNDLVVQFKKQYEQLYGHWLDHGVIEIESLRLVAASRTDIEFAKTESVDEYLPPNDRIVHAYVGDDWMDIPGYNWETLSTGAVLEGPSLLMSQNATVFIDIGWTVTVGDAQNVVMLKTVDRKNKGKPEKENYHTSAGLELFSNRFKSVADDMGAVLRRTSFSVNVKERLDFSCAVLDANGYLVANAPHIPVHLGGLGICVRSVAGQLPMNPGDVVITNHPAFGGSHLPDITLICPVYDSENILIGYVANRAHHAELGGITPGSVPANARNLQEEGVVIKPTYLAKDGVVDWSGIKDVLSDSMYPTRSLGENLADLNGALASIRTGVQGLRALCTKSGRKAVSHYMEALQQYSDQCLSHVFEEKPEDSWQAMERMDDGHCLKVAIKKSDGRIIFDFTGSSGLHPGNLNATYAILNSSVIYVLKLMIREPIPLNEGIMRHIRIKAPAGFLNPDFNDDSGHSPAVVGGNTEVSQRIVDTLIKAFGLAACSQGTMNNLIFGNDDFGFYETIGGGVGAGPGFHGADAVHQHMTNTRITDPEIMEHRYPVQVERMAVRKWSGGKGKWNGGDGIIRELLFNECVDLNILSQHRVVPPYGLDGGDPGATGEQHIIRADGAREKLVGMCEAKINPGDRVVIKTPGGGGYGNNEG